MVIFMGFSIEKNKSVMFTRKRGVDAQIKMYGQRIEQVKVIRFLGVWFDTKLTWNEHIHKINTKCKMRCLTGSELGAVLELHLKIFI